MYNVLKTTDEMMVFSCETLSAVYSCKPAGLKGGGPPFMSMACLHLNHLYSRFKINPLLMFKSKFKVVVQQD